MSEILRQGGSGQEVRRLQTNLNAAIGRRYGLLKADGFFGPKTKTAVERYQKDFRLKFVDGIVGLETRSALATRVLVIEGRMSRTDKPSSPKPPGPPRPAPPTPGTIVKPPASPFLIQLQPAFGLTPSPFGSSPPSSAGTVIAGQLAIGIVYRTALEGPHWEFGGAFQPSFNSRSQPTDSRYTLQLQGSASYADPLSAGRFHTALFGQVVVLQNLSPATTVAGLQLGGQVSVDIIGDKWNLFLQGALAGQWTLHDSSGPAGQLQFGPQISLGTTIQWGL
jgi:Putative peptidoglycan binding domain